MRLSRQIANETLATNGPAGDIYAALHDYIPLATDGDIQDWINTYASEDWSSQDEMVRTITGDASVRCSVSAVVYSVPPSGAKLNLPRQLLLMSRNPSEPGPTNGLPLSLAVHSPSMRLRTGISSVV
jgi:hypothetical protein